MLSKNEMNALFVETAPPLIAFLQKEKQKILSEVKRLQKKDAKQRPVEAEIETEAETETEIEAEIGAETKTEIEAAPVPAWVTEDTVMEQIPQ